MWQFKWANGPVDEMINELDDGNKNLHEHITENSWMPTSSETVLLFFRVR